MGYYTQCHTVMNRLLIAANEDDHQSQVGALGKFLRLAIDVHRIRRVIIIIRDSPPGDETQNESRSASASISRQFDFLQAVLPDDVDVDVDVIRLPHVSAFSSTEVVDQIAQAPYQKDGRSMVVSSSLDRIIRSQANCDRLREVLSNGSHFAMSFLWDSATVVRPAEAMLLPDTV